MDPEERRKRHELSYGMYNFRDVKLHFSRQGWTYRPGPSLSYDHYYIKPGKNPRNKHHKQGVDYFLGEAELVAYARKMKIFGDETAPLPAAGNGQRHGKRRARSSSSARTSQTTVERDSDSDEEQRPKRHRRRSSENKVGNSAQNPIALSSDSSDEETAGEGNQAAAVETSSVEDEDEEWTEGDTNGGFGQEEEEEEEEVSEEDSSSSSSTSSVEEDTNEELEDEDMGTTANAKKVEKRSQGKRRPRGKATKQEEHDKVKSSRNVASRAEAKTNAHWHDSSPSSSDNEENPGRDHKYPRPLLKTSSKKKHRKVMQTSNRLPQHGIKHYHEKKRAAKSLHSKHKPLQTRVAKKAKSAPRSVFPDSMHGQDGGWEDNSFNLDVGHCGVSPPRLPPSRAHSRANSVRSSPATSVVAPSPPPAFAYEEDEALPAPSTPASFSSALSTQAATVSATSHSFISSSTGTIPTPTPIITPSSDPKTTNATTTPIVTPSPSPMTSSSRSVPRTTSSVPPTSFKKVVSTSAQVSMELTQVVLPPDRNSKYHIRVTMSTDKPPAHTIWMKNLKSHEQRESTFIDLTELPDAKPDIRVPTDTVLTAFFRCLSSQPDTVVIVGPEPRATAESKAASEKAEVQLRTSTAEKNTGDANIEGSQLTLWVAYPALELFRVDHFFPMKLVSKDQGMQHLAKEVERLTQQLHAVQADRDKLCEQLRQQEVDNERTLSQRVEARVKAKVAAQSARLQEQFSKEELEQRVAKLVDEKAQALEQAQQKGARDRDRARRWVFARSDWMTAFQPCRALMAGVTGETQTSLLRPATAANPRKYVVEWKEVVEIAEPFFQPTTSGSTRSITVVKDGTYQVNVNVSHDSLVQLRLVVTSEDATASPREIKPTKVLLFDDKRRASRVDTMLELRALDQLSLELRLLSSAAAPSPQEEWLRTPMPTHNRLLIVVLDEHATT